MKQEKLENRISEQERNDIYADNMTLRDYFAGQALAGLTSLSPIDMPYDVEMAYKYADAMLKAREKE